VRVKALQAKHASDWLKLIPNQSGTIMDDNQFCLAVHLRLGIGNYFLPINYVFVNKYPK